MYNANLIYADDEIEENLKVIAENVFPAPLRIQQNNEKRLVFYDYFMLDNRGLTEQYLDALFDSEYEILFVGCPNGEQSKEIIDKLEVHKVQFVFIDEKQELSNAKIIFDSIINFNPAIILAHTSPWDVAGLMAISRFEKCSKRYLVNITDHAFWLGTKVFDYFIEFRDYGYNISKNYRRIDAKNLLKLPYYPNINKNIPFAGFDFDARGKKIVLSGGSIYKIQGSPVFFDLVKYILSTYEDTIFLFLGNGDASYLQKFIDDNNFQNRFYYRKERKDIWEVFKHCDMFLNTYPITGGLMTQYACMAGVVPVTLNDGGDNSDGNIYELLLSDYGLNFQCESLESCKAKIDEYMLNPNALKSDGLQLTKAVISRKMFSEMLLNYLETPVNKMVFNAYNVDIKRFSKQYIQRFNENDGMSYYSCFVRKDVKYLLKFPIYYIKYIWFKTKYGSKW